MTLPASGPITGAAINVELGVASTTALPLGGAGARGLAGIPSGAIRMGADFYGKSSTPPPTVFSPYVAQTVSYQGGGGPGAIVDLLSDGSISRSGNGSVLVSTGSNQWCSTVAPGVGAFFWCQFSQTSGVGASTNSAPAPGWHPLTSNRRFSRASPGADPQRILTFTIRIATDAAGTNIVATWTGNQVITNP